MMKIPENDRFLMAYPYSWKLGGIVMAYLSKTF